MDDQRQDDDDKLILIRIKAVPGASRDVISGILGDRLKVRISAPPEDGKANKAICKLLANALGIKSAQVVIHSGHTNAHKTIQIKGCSIASIGAALKINPDAIKGVIADKSR